ncbi:arylsulfatase [Rhodopirellula sallentina]|uniref:Arylsulfatase n=1 Tax=Rhodopirellula sallentina SM41 TaxID=1263870 RepID=M5U6J9_9BACT|nr:arylsulfatase [Rhodopirellula sallentina]EMI57097.1 arylsulfatase [Rhodopirellula sallentina SM41]
MWNQLRCRLNIVATASFLATFLVACAAESAEPPNVLVVLFDDLGYSDLGCYGGEIPTPNIDGLSRGGLRFTRMTTSARCCPSRAALLTGLHPGQAGIPNFGGQLVDNCATLAEVLKANGYSTYAVGKWHVGHTPVERGFDEYYGFPAGHSRDQWRPNAYVRLPRDREPEIKVAENEFYATDVFTEYALEFLDQAEAKQKPWFMYLAHSSPHFPLQAPIESTRSFVSTYRQGWDKLRADRFMKMKQIGLIQDHRWKLTERSLVPVESRNAIANGYSGKPNPAWDELSSDLQEDLAHRMAIYAAMVKHVDVGVGRIIDRLNVSGQLENTLVLILSDNGACYEWGPLGFDDASRKGITHLYRGERLKQIGLAGTYISVGSAWANLSNTPHRLYKHFTHEGGILSPMVVHWPAGIQEPGRWVRDSAHLIDVMSTVVDVTGASYPTMIRNAEVQPMEGVSLASLFTPGNSLAERTLCYQHSGARAIQSGDWKLVLGKRFPTTPKWELYNIKDDPCETVDLAPQNPERVAIMTKQWEAWAKRTTALAPGNKPKG